jgi:two-component system cell cycle sensor histidine kinase/response regulator CckA
LTPAHRQLILSPIGTFRRNLLAGGHLPPPIYSEPRSADAVDLSAERLRAALASLKAVVWEAAIVDDVELPLTFLSGPPGLFTADGMIQSTFSSLVLDEDRSRVIATCCSLSDARPTAPIEFRVRAATGPPRWFSGEVTLLSDSPSRRLRGVASDITERRQASADDVAARRGLEEQLRLSQNLESVGRLAAGIAHDFNNLLLLVTGHAEVLASEVQPGSRLQRAVDGVLKATDRATQLTQQLLAFSKRQVLKPQVLNLHQLIMAMTPMLQTLLQDDIELVIEPCATPGMIKADPGQLERIVLNLAANARDAMPSGGTFRVAIDSLVLEHGRGRRAGDLRAGRYVRLALTDTGMGMTAETQQRIFEPFFTTKSRGTGLGLATVYGIVSQSGGYVSVASEIGVGTTFTVLLPQVDDAPDAIPSRARAEQPAQSNGHEVVLLVEDEDAVRSLLRESLETYGYTVIEARGGNEALGMARQAQPHLDLLVTDMIMPQMNGRELADQLCVDHPDLRVLYITGYNDREVVIPAGSEHRIELLRKPFTGREFARVVRDLLDRR